MSIEKFDVHRIVLKDKHAIINTPPKVGVPFFDKWLEGPPDLIGWPNGNNFF